MRPKECVSWRASCTVEELAPCLAPGLTPARASVSTASKPQQMVGKRQASAESLHSTHLQKRQVLEPQPEEVVSRTERESNFIFENSSS